jgi:hypothetical protein
VRGILFLIGVVGRAHSQVKLVDVTKRFDIGDNCLGYRPNALA